MYNEDQIGRGEIILSFTKEGNLFHITSANSPLIRFVYQDKILFLFSCLLLPPFRITCRTYGF